MPYPDQWAFLSTLPKVTPEQLTGLLTTLCQDGDVGALAETAESLFHGSASGHSGWTGQIFRFK